MSKNKTKYATIRLSVDDMKKLDALVAYFDKIRDDKQSRSTVIRDLVRQEYSDLSLIE